MDCDTIVIGSGFGGSVTACRLAEAGDRVIVLERGRRWDSSSGDGRTSYPRKPTDPWWWSQHDPVRWNGWVDLRVFRHMAVAQGAAVGGGSLIYANISAIPDERIFKLGWPQGIDWWSDLRPHYQTVGHVMDVQKVPDGQWPRRMQMMQEGADKIGESGRFDKLTLAVSFDPAFKPEPHREIDPATVARAPNRHGVKQGKCVHLGNCDIGCDVDAKNTLDRNYLALAEQKGAVVRPLHLVTAIEPVGGGYCVHYDAIGNGERQPGSATAKRVVVSAGSLNSTELLLLCRDVHKTLPNISGRLGHNWSSNGDFLTPAFYRDRQLFPWRGPTITSVINFLDGSQGGKEFWIQDGGFPHILNNWLKTADAADPKVRAFLKWFREKLEEFGPLDSVMPWFAQGIDAANGHLRLRRRWWLFGPWKLVLDWDIEESRALIDAIVAMHVRLSQATGGHAVVPITWTQWNYLITPHPLGGCNMGNEARDGVVDHKGEVFGYRNLFVLDGAIVPEAVGVNPSRTIAALAERAVVEMRKSA